MSKDVYKFLIFSLFSIVKLDPAHYKFVTNLNSAYHALKYSIYIWSLRLKNHTISSAKKCFVSKNKTLIKYSSLNENFITFFNEVLTLRVYKDFPNTEFFWSVLSHIQTEYREILHISPYSARMRENTDQKKLRIWTLFTQCVIFLFPCL